MNRTNKQNKPHSQDQHPILAERTHWITNPVELTGALLLILSLMIGPLLVGSYFGGWRIPLLVCSSAAIIVIIINGLIHRNTRKTKWSWLLVLILLWPIVQGCWMWYNAWGAFNPIIPDPGAILWKHPLLRELPNQPFPDLPGTAEGGEAWDRLSYIIPCLGLVWSTRALILSRPSWCRLIALAIFGTGVAVAIIGLLQHWTGAQGIYWSSQFASIERKLFFGTYRSPGIAACYLNIALAMGLHVFLAPAIKTPDGKNTGKRLVRAMLFIVGLITLTTAAFSTGSKTGAILTVLTLLAWALLNRRTLVSAFRKSAELFPGNRYLERNLVAICILCIAVIAILSVAGGLVSRWQVAKERNFTSLSGRGAVNAMQIDMIKYDDWGTMGYGPGSFYPLFPYFAKDHDIEGIYVYSHNDYLQTLVEWGWLGTACFALIIFGGVYFLMRGIFLLRGDYRRRQIILMRGYLIAIVMCLLHALIDFPFQIESIAVTMAVLLGVAWATPALRIPTQDASEETELTD